MGYFIIRRFVHLGLFVLSLALLCSCGGNSGTVGIASGKALFTTAPNSIAMQIGVANYSIGGGTAPYKTAVSNTSIAITAVSGSNLTVIGITAGTAQISIVDATGATINVSLSVGSSTSSTHLFTTAPNEMILAVGKVVAFTIGGGEPHYFVSSSNTAVATVGINNNTFIISGAALGTAEVTVFDSAGTAVRIVVTVGSGSSSIPLYVNAAGTINFALNETNIFSIGGGTAPYSVTSTNAGAATASITNSALIVTGHIAGLAQIQVYDAKGSLVSFNASVGSGSTDLPLFVAAPSAITMSVMTRNTYNIGGGTAPYTVVTSNVGVAAASLDGNSISIDGNGSGTAQIVVFDAKGGSVTLSINIPSSSGSTSPLYTTAPTSITTTAGTASTFKIGGGVAPYSVSSNNVGVVTASVSDKTLSIFGVASGAAQIMLFDATGASLTIGITVTQVGVSAVDVQPSVATGNVGDTLRFTVTAGSPPYNITVNNASIATTDLTTISSSGGVFSTTLLNVGATSVTIRDSIGQIKSLDLSVNQISTALRLSPNILTIGEDNVTDITLSIYGGVAPYNAFTSDEVLTSVITSGAKLVVGLGSETNRCINPVDSSNVRIPGGTYDITITVLDSLGASAKTTLTIKDNNLGSGAVTTQVKPFVVPCQ